MHVIDVDVRNVAGVGTIGFLRLIGPIEIDDVVAVAELARVRPANHHIIADAIARAEFAELQRVRGIELHQNDVAVGGHRVAAREFECDAAAHAPMICGIGRVVQRDRASGDVVQLDVFIRRVIRRPRNIRRAIHDLAENDWADFRPGEIRQAGALPEQIQPLEKQRQVVVMRAERQAGHRDKIHVAVARHVMSK